MRERDPATGLTRRDLFLAAAAGYGDRDHRLARASASDDAVELIKHLTGNTPTESDRLRLVMPRTFPNGYTVPLSLDVDSPMTEKDHVKYVRVLAPRNPLIEVATFHFVPAAEPTPRVDSYPPCRAAICLWPLPS